MFIEKFDTSSYFLRSSPTLYLHRIKIKLNAGVASLRHRNHIMHHRAGRRGNNANALRISRQGLLTGPVKETLRSQLLLQLFILLHQIAGALL